MGKLANVFGIIVLVLAIVAAALSFMIASRRAEFKGRADGLATAVAGMVKEIDKQSGTSVSSQVSFTPKSGDSPESGKLSWSEYTGNKSSFDGATATAVKHASAINAQRNGLAEAVEKMASDLMIPDTELDVSNLKDLSGNGDFEKARDAAVAHAAAVKARDEAMIEAIVKAASEAEADVEEDAFTKREETTDADENKVLGDYPCTDSLMAFTLGVSGLRTRTDSYAKTLQDAVDTISTHKWATSKAAIARKDDYERALTSLNNDFSDINKKLVEYEQNKQLVVEQKKKIDDLEDEVEQTRGELTKAQGTLAEADRLIKELKKRGIIEGGPSLTDVSQDVTGSVVEVNEDWNFVILDLGFRDIKENTQMLVARGEDLVAKVQVSKVLGKVSVAEILPELNATTVRVNDRVIMPMLQDIE